MPKDYWFKIDTAKYRQPMIPIWPKGYLALGFFVILMMIGFTLGAYGYYLFPSIETWITIAVGILIAIISFAFLIHCRHHRSKG